MILRWLKIGLIAACTIVALAAAFVHWRSHRISSVGHWYGEKSWAGIYCARGKIVVGIGREAVEAVVKHDFYERPVKGKESEFDFEGSFQGRRWMGFGYFRSYSPRQHYFLAPLWMFWVLGGVPLLWVICKRLRKRVRRGSNLCVNCGYDLRGISGRCPECGSEVAPGGEARPVRSVVV